MTGRPPKPKDLKRAQGNPGREALAKLAEPDETYEVESEDELPETILHVPPPPPWLVSDSDASALAINAWNTLAQILIDARRLGDGDLSNLARYCRYLAEWGECTKDIDARGIVTVTARGEGRNASFLARQQLEKDLIQLEKELGLTPKSRTNLQRQLMAALESLPHAGRPQKSARSGGPVGWLESD
jgi:P27 family predicted phage terminase small subunit